MIKTTVLTDLEGHVGLWVGCWPTLQPLLRIAKQRLGFSSSTPLTPHEDPSSNTHIGKPKTQGYIQHGPKRADSLSDDASGKGIIRQRERESDLEMNYLQSVSVTQTADGAGRLKGNKRGIVMTTDIVVNHH
jgi:hypothetical protein